MSFVPASITLPKGETTRTLHWSSDTSISLSTSNWMITRVKEAIVGSSLDLSRWTITPVGHGLESGMNDGILTFNNAGFPSATSVSDTLLSLNWSLGKTLKVFADIDGLPTSFDIQLTP